MIYQITYDDRDHHTSEPLLEDPLCEGLTHPCQPILCFAEEGEGFHFYVRALQLDDFKVGRDENPTPV